MSESGLERDAIEELTEEFLERRREGEDLSIDAFATEHPGAAERIRELFPVLLLMEGLGSDQTEAIDQTESAPESKCPIERLGDYRILREIGRGGMGVVYEAEQESLGRRVALKVLPKAHLASAEGLARFKREAQAAARLLHTNIVPVFGVGHQDGIHYYVMQYIDGRGLDGVLEQLAREHRDDLTDGADEKSTAGSAVTQSFASPPNRTGSDTVSVGPHDHGDRVARKRALSSASANGSRSHNGRYWRSVAEIGVQVAQALDYAHQQGTLHRDIKPGNLLVDTQGTVWITDFGLAKLAEHDDLTRSGDMLGTLRYMAPEQFEGKSDARSDVYSLGLTLYELLTLRPAFGETSCGRLLRQVPWQEPPRPRKIDPAIPRDLETVVLKATAADGNNRYQTAGDLEKDLRRFLEDRPIRARRTTPVEHLWRWCRRNRAIAALTISVMVSLVAIAVVASVGYFQTMNALASVSKQQEHAESARQDALEEGRRADLERNRAEANLRLAIRAFDDIFTQVTVDPVSRPPDEDSEENWDSEEDWLPTSYEAPVTAKDAALLESMLSFYDQFARQNDSDLNLDMESARARRRVGDIQRGLGQYEKAEEAYRRALELYGQLAEDAGDSPEHAVQIAVIHNELGIVYERTGRMREAMDSLLEAERILKGQAEQIAELPECRFELARTHNSLGSMILRRGPRFGPPESPGSRSEKRTDASHQADFRGKPSPRFESGPPSPPSAGSRSGSMRGGRGFGPERTPPGADLFERHRPDRARHEEERTSFAAGPGRPGFGSRGPSANRYHQQALDILEELLKSEPQNPEYRLAAAQSYRNLMVGWWFVGTRDTDNDPRKEAIHILEELVADFPSSPDYAYELAETYAMIVPGRRGGSRDGDVLERLTRAVEIGTDLVERFPNVPEYAASLARSHLGMAGMQTGSESPDQANQHYRRAVEIQRSLVADFPTVPGYRFDFARTIYQWATINRLEGHHKAARPALEEAIANWESLADMEGGPPQIRGVLAQLYRDLADTLREAGEGALADEAAKKSREIDPRRGSPMGHGGPGFRAGRPGKESDVRLGSLLEETASAKPD